VRISYIGRALSRSSAAASLTISGLLPEEVGTSPRPSAITVARVTLAAAALWPSVNVQAYVPDEARNGSNANLQDA
jgi:hypothetical protein